MAKKKQKNGKTLVTFVLDRSGSMELIKSDTIGAFNAYLKTLKKDKEASVKFTFVTFDTMSVDKVCVRENVANVDELTDETYQPRAGTPLIKTAYDVIKATEKALKKGEKAVVCIQTDGEENSSGPDYPWDKLKDLISQKMEEGWQFNFMGAGIDAYDQGVNMGIPVSNTISYDSNDKVATHAAFVASAANTMAFASGRNATTEYSAKQKFDAKDKFDPAGAKVQRRGRPDAILTLDDDAEDINFEHTSKLNLNG